MTIVYISKRLLACNLNIQHEITSTVYLTLQQREKDKSGTTALTRLVALDWYHFRVDSAIISAFSFSPPNQLTRHLNR